MTIQNWVIFAKNNKVVTIEEGDLGYIHGDFFADAIFLKIVAVKRMGPRILQRLLEK